jgi:DNA polymerase-3 subunit gamma/tau
VADREGIAIDDGAVELLGELGRGSLRDALGMLDQLASFERAGDAAGERVVSVDDVRGLLGVSRSETVIRVATALADRDASAALTQVNAVVGDGLDPRQLNRELAAVLRELLQRRAGARLPANPELDPLAERFTLQQLLDVGKIFAESDARMRNAVIPQMPLELSLVEAILSLGTSAGAEQPPRAYEPQRDQPAETRAVAEAPPPRTSLRDSVRQRPPAGEAPAVPMAPATAEAPASSRNRTAGSARSTPPAATSAGTSSSGDGISLEWLVDEWSKIRNDVKAVDRRVEALLSQADPHAVIDDLVVLSAPYQFHRDQLNKDDKRGVVEDVVSRRAGGRRYRMTCVDRNEGIGGLGAAPAVRAAPAATAPASAVAVEPEPDPAATAVAPSLSLDEQRIRAAASIFDAEVIDE